MNDRRVIRISRSERCSWKAQYWFIKTAVNQTARTSTRYVVIFLGLNLMSLTKLAFPHAKKNNQIHALTDVGTAMGKGANTIGVRMRTTYLRHFRKHFATEVSTGSEETASAELAGFWCLFSEFSVAFSLTASDERQTTFVSPISIVFISWFALVAALNRPKQGYLFYDGSLLPPGRLRATGKT